MPFIRYICVLNIFFATHVLASEIDSFTLARKPIRDSKPIVDKKSKELFEEALLRANKKGICSKDRLYDALSENFHNHVFGKISKWMWKTRQVDYHRLERKNSIYADFGVFDSLVLSGVLEKVGIAQILQIAMGKMMLYGDLYIGSDKFEHFWGTGFDYFKRYRFKSKTLQQVMAYGESLESGTLGLRTTGIYSYADLAANFDGLRFWNHILLEEDDPLGEEHNLGPYVACQGGRWVIIQFPDWSDYANLAWSEAHNCSKFRNQKLLEKVKARLAALEGGEANRCPVSDESFEALKLRYTPFESQLLNRRMSVFSKQR